MIDAHKPVYAGMDLGGSDFSMLGQMVGSMMMSSAQVLHRAGWFPGTGAFHQRNGECFELRDELRRCSG